MLAPGDRAIWHLHPLDRAELALPPLGGESSVPAPQALRIKAFVDDETGRPGFVVIDDASGEVVREIPTEEVLELAAKLKQMTGLLVNEAV